MPLHLYLGDITKMKTDAIVNAANTDLKPYPGICEAVFQAAGEEELEKHAGRLDIVPSAGLW